MKNALVLQGAIGLKTDRYGDTCSGATTDFIDYETCYKSIYKHVIKNNNFDVFIQCWTLSLRDQLIELYNPVKHSFDDDRDPIIQNSINIGLEKNSKSRRTEISKCKSWELSVDMVTQHCLENDIQYEKVMVCRPDIYYRRSLNLDDYDVTNLFYANNPHPHPYEPKPDDKGGDFHFIMSFNTFTKMKNMINSISETFRPDWHVTIEDYVVGVLNIKTKADSFIAGYGPGGSVDIMRCSVNCTEHLD